APPATARCSCARDRDGRDTTRSGEPGSPIRPARPSWPPPSDRASGVPRIPRARLPARSRSASRAARARSQVHPEDDPELGAGVVAQVQARGRGGIAPHLRMPPERQLDLIGLKIDGRTEKDRGGIAGIRIEAVSVRTLEAEREPGAELPRD